MALQVGEVTAAATTVVLVVVRVVELDVDTLDELDRADTCADDVLELLVAVVAIEEVVGVEVVICVVVEDGPGLLLELEEDVGSVLDDAMLELLATDGELLVSVPTVLCVVEDGATTELLGLIDVDCGAVEDDEMTTVEPLRLAVVDGTREVEGVLCVMDV